MWRSLFNQTRQAFLHPLLRISTFSIARYPMRAAQACSAGFPQTIGPSGVISFKPAVRAWHPLAKKTVHPNRYFVQKPKT
jgi:hypothetical protein